MYSSGTGTFFQYHRDKFSILDFPSIAFKIWKNLLSLLLDECLVVCLFEMEVKYYFEARPLVHSLLQKCTPGFVSTGNISFGLL